MAIAAALENPKKLYADRKNEYFTTQFKRFTTEITIFLPVYWLKKAMYGITITEDKLCFVNDFIEKRMEEELFMLANFYSNVASLQFKDAITDFCNTHNIELEEDISYDGMKKKFYRNRQRRGIVKAKPVKCNLEAVQISAIL